MIINLNPDRELIIDKIDDEEAGEEDTDADIKGIIFTMGKVTIKNGAKVSGAIIAAGRGYDPANKVGESAADFYNGTVPRLPRIVGDTNISNFKNWDYAALILDSGMCFSGREALLDSFSEENENGKFSEILKGIF